MNRFLSFISKRYRLKPEDVATDVLAYLLQQPNIQDSVSRLLAELGYPYMKPEFSVEIRPPGESGRKTGIPDIILTNIRDGHRVVIEDKFGAAFNQESALFLSC